MIAVVVFAAMVAILAIFGIWFVGRLAKIDRETVGKLEDERRAVEAQR